MDLCALKYCSLFKITCYRYHRVFIQIVWTSINCLRCLVWYLRKIFLRPKGFRYNHAEPLVLYGLSTMCVPILLLYVQYNLHPDTPLSESENMMPHTMLKSSQGKLWSISSPCSAFLHISLLIYFDNNQICLSNYNNGYWTYDAFT